MAHIQPHDISDNGDGPYCCRSCGASYEQANDGRTCSDAYQRKLNEWVRAHHGPYFVEDVKSPEQLRRELAVWAETVQVAVNACRDAEPE